MIRISEAFEPGHSIFFNIACAPNESSDQPAYLLSLIRVFARQSGAPADPSVLLGAYRILYEMLCLGSYVKSFYFPL